MSNSHANYQKKFRYFGKDLTNFEGSFNGRYERSSKSRNRSQKQARESNKLYNYTQKLRQRYKMGRKKSKKPGDSGQLRRAQKSTPASRRNNNPRVLNKKISNFDFEPKRTSNARRKRHIIPNHIRAMRYELRKSQKSANLNLRRSKNSSNKSSRSRNLMMSKEKIIGEYRNYRKVEKLLNEYISKSKASIKNGDLSTENIIPYENYRGRRNPLTKNSKSIEFGKKDNSFYISRERDSRLKTRRRSSQRALRKGKTVGFLLEKYFMGGKGEKSMNLTRPRMAISKGILSPKGSRLARFAKEQLMMIPKKREEERKMKEESIFMEIRKKRSFEREMKEYELNASNPGFNFIDKYSLNFPNIWNFLISTKEKNIQRVDYIESKIQNEITVKMRVILIDWLIDVHKKFKLKDQTLFIAVNMIDRTLEKVKIEKRNFQLLGVTCLFSASKYEEIYPPPISEYTYVCADAYKDSDLLEMEAQVLHALNFNLVFTSTHSLYVSYSDQKLVKGREYYLGMYILHIALLSTPICKEDPCSVAASVFLLVSRLLKGSEICLEELVRDFNCSEEKLRNISQDLFMILCEEKRTRFTAARRKFDCPEFKSVSAIQIGVKVR